MNILKDKEWHCIICAFGDSSSYVASTARELRKDGYKFETDPNNNKRFCQIKFCDKCDRNTIYRKLK
ncbi:hypothetical protein ACP0SI_04710 [Campylobacter coli]